MRGIHWACLISGVVVLCAALPASGDKAPSPPGGIMPTTATLDDVLAASERASGADKHWLTRVADGHVSMWGLNGAFHDVYASDDVKHSVDLGPLRYQAGSLNGQRWRQDENGMVVLLHDTVHPDETDTTALTQYLKDRDHLTLLGETGGAHPAYVIQNRSTRGAYVWLFIDKATKLVSRIEAVNQDARIAYTFEDYRRSGAFTEPWHVHISDGIARNDADWVVTSDRHNVPVTGADMAMPQSNPNLLLFPAGATTVKLPARVVDGDIVVRLNIAGQGLDFILDSGAGGILIDSGTADRLHLKRFGQWSQTAKGSFFQTGVLVPELRIGDIQMKNVVAHSLPFSVEQRFGTDVVGLLGFDFIANVALKVDYYHGDVEAMRPELFVPPADADALSATLDDGVPFIPVQIGAARGVHFVLDTGASDGVIFSTFATEHPDDVKDQGRGQMVNAWLPLIGALTVGGIVQTKATEVKNLDLGGVEFDEWLMFATPEHHAFEGQDTDGLIGYDFLKFFTVYFDYRDSEIYLEPNAWFNRVSAKRTT